MKSSFPKYGLMFLLLLSLQPLATSQEVASPSPAAGYQVLHRFAGSPDGATPIYELALDSAGNLYGVTVYGGKQDLGTVYKVDPAGKETVLRSFSGEGADGDSPFAPLTLDSAGNLYGSTTDGGVGSFGTLFKISPAGNENILYSFAGGKDGSGPVGRLVLDDAGNLYGTTTGGGAFNHGTVFKLMPGSRKSVLHSFRWTDGFPPLGGLIRDPEGNLYGTTERGGTNSACNGVGCGTVFKLDKTGKYTVLHSFVGTNDGGQPAAGVIRDAMDNLYGTASSGGDLNCGSGNGCGVVFKLDRNGEETVLHNFVGGTDGASPGGQLFQDDVGNLYGTTVFGGDNNQLCNVADNGCGVVFKIDTAARFTTLYAFKGYPSHSGGEPAAGVIRDTAGNLYGITQIGGDLNCQPVNGCGVVFKLTP